MRAISTRRRFIAGLTTVVLGAPPAAAQRRPRRIGVLHLGAGADPWTEGFRRGLLDRGYAEERDVVLDFRFAAGRVDRLADLVGELIAMGPSVLVGMAGPAVMAAKRGTTTIPIVMAVSGDPVGLGVVSNLSRPGGNVTGISLMSDDLAALRLNLLKEAIPQAARMAVLYNPAEPPTGPEMEQTRAAARLAGVEILPLPVQGADALDDALRHAVRERAHGLITFAHGFAFLHRKRIVGIAGQLGLPAIYGWREYADDGGLMALGPNVPDMLKRAAAQVDLILKGTNPGQIPVEQPTRFELVANLKTAKTLGLVLPEAILVRADAIIE